MHHQAKARQLSVQSETNSTPAYPEYLVPYVVHALAHHSCPDVDECKDVEAYELVYRQVYLTISPIFILGVYIYIYNIYIYIRKENVETSVKNRE